MGRRKWGERTDGAIGTGMARTSIVVTGSRDGAEGAEEVEEAEGAVDEVETVTVAAIATMDSVSSGISSAKLKSVGIRCPLDSTGMARGKVLAPLPCALI